MFISRIHHFNVVHVVHARFANHLILTHNYNRMFLRWFLLNLIV